MPEILTKRPYLIRAIFDWALDNGLTPHVLVNTTVAGVKIPAGHAPEGKITLNIHPQAVQALELGKEWIMFSARFSGRRFGVEIPMAAVMAIFARENGQGFRFPRGDRDLARIARTSTFGDTPVAQGPGVENCQVVRPSPLLSAGVREPPRTRSTACMSTGHTR